jgi:hypothetical protein
MKMLPALLSLGFAAAPAFGKGIGNAISYPANPPICEGESCVFRDAGELLTNRFQIVLRDNVNVATSLLKQMSRFGYNVPSTPFLIDYTRLSGVSQEVIYGPLVSHDEKTERLPETVDGKRYSNCGGTKPLTISNTDTTREKNIDQNTNKKTQSRTRVSTTELNASAQYAGATAGVKQTVVETIQSTAEETIVSIIENEKSRQVVMSPEIPVNGVLDQRTIFRTKIVHYSVDVKILLDGDVSWVSTPNFKFGKVSNFVDDSVRTLHTVWDVKIPVTDISQKNNISSYTDREACILAFDKLD